MRHTSSKRRSSSLAQVYRGAPTRPNGSAGRDLTVPEGTPDSVICKACGARLPILANGRPKGHAPGGVTSSFARNRFRCEGSGNTGSS